MLTLKELVKGELPQVRPEDTLKEAAKVIYEGGLGAALSLDRQGRVTYMITKMDIAKALARGDDLEIATVEDYGTPSPLQAQANTDLITALKLMKEYKVSHLPVIENERVIGLVYIRDVVFSLIDHLPRGKASVSQVAKRAPRVPPDSTVAEAASEMVMADCEAVFVDGTLLTDTDVVRASAYGDPYAEKASKYSTKRIITTDAKSDLECAVRLMKANGVGKLVVWKEKIVSVRDIGYLIPDIVKRLTKYIVLIKGELPQIKGTELIRTVGDFDAIAIVEGDEELFKLVDKLKDNEIKILVERP
ncbi:hypothetical protein IPA_06645 [Ignicoccus pacificus DSM 13166]|uniref:CBS domain-containing protein n=1 Tax=Ignicoccus pacificus DSM 13166 TaxID=940294 RepID=A0A977KCH7_9CREN|nr:hypothetical protein IPA_06645 [Ignicoccus pacificus DSM 13166]